MSTAFPGRLVREEVFQQCHLLFGGKVIIVPVSSRPLYCIRLASNSYRRPGAPRAESSGSTPAEAEASGHPGPLPRPTWQDTRSPQKMQMENIRGQNSNRGPRFLGPERYYGSNLGLFADRTGGWRRACGASYRSFERSPSAYVSPLAKGAFLCLTGPSPAPWLTAVRMVWP